MASTDSTCQWHHHESICQWHLTSTRKYMSVASTTSTCTITKKRRLFTHSRPTFILTNHLHEDIGKVLFSLTHLKSFFCRKVWHLFFCAFRNEIIASKTWNFTHLPTNSSSEPSSKKSMGSHRVARLLYMSRYCWHFCAEIRIQTNNKQQNDKFTEFFKIW